MFRNNLRARLSELSGVFGIYDTVGQGFIDSKMVQLRLAEMGIPMAHEDLMVMFAEGHSYVAKHMAQAKEAMEARAAIKARERHESLDLDGLPNIADYSKAKMNELMANIPMQARH